MTDFRTTPDGLLGAIVQANNQDMLDNIGANFHLRRYTTLVHGDPFNPVITRGGPVFAQADVTVDVDGWALANSIKRIADAHFTDTIAHDTATSAAITIADATDTASAVSLANELKAQYNTHRTAANVHFTDDNTNTVTNADATDDPTMQVLVNELKNVFVVIHTQSAPPGTYINLTPA
jgi:hypothetical protein